jgi:hypothetical protein
MRKIFVVVWLCVISFYLNAQIVINEASNRNYTQISVAEGDNLDWIELYNSGSANVNIGGWGLSDKKSVPLKWIFPSYVMSAHSYLLVFASGLDIQRTSAVNHWESAILPADTFNYIEPDATTPDLWNIPGFDCSSWGTGQAGFGYGDNDDATITNDSIAAVYILKTFSIPDTSAIAEAILHVDYDDGFVAYLNGVEIARRNVDGNPSWNSLASASRDAQMYQGGSPERIDLDFSLLQSIWKQGDNVFAIEVHNSDLTSSDLSLIPFLSFGISNGNTYFQPVPDWFSASTGISLHTNFKISYKGEGIYLSDDSGIIADSLKIPRIPLNSSFGKTTNGAASTGIFLKATPGTSNNSSQVYTNGYEPTPVFDHVAGFYTSSINVSIEDSSATAVVRYTTDGSEPTVGSTVYNGTPITISSTKTLKARSFSTTDKLPGDTKTATYFINISHTIPVISITTNNENLYGTNGIFDHWDMTWNKPCYVEYFDSEKQLIFNEEAGIQIDGGAGGSRSQPQHSVRIEPGNSTFGAGDVEYALIPDRPNRQKYSSFYLRNGSNQYNYLQYKDGLEVKAIGKNTFTYYSAYTPIVAYINGGYFGVYELREKLNEDFLKENYLMDNDSLDLLTLSYFKGSVLQALNGSTDQFWIDFENFKNLTPSSSSYLGDASKILDLNNYTDYIIAESWIGNTDWPWNNIRVFRNKSTGFRWQFALQDVEWALFPNGWSSSTIDHIGFMNSQDNNLPYIGFWLRLIQNNQYKVNFINRFADLMNTNYLFSTTGPMEQEFYDLQYSEMAAEFARWGNSNVSAFTNNHNIMRSELENRSETVRQNLQSHFNLSTQVEVTLNALPEGAGQIKISTIIPVYYPWDGIYFSNNPVKITALPNPGYKFKNWDDNSLISDPNSAEITVSLTGTAQTFTANFEASADEFDGITISEIHYKNGINENSDDWVEIYNGGNADVSLKDWYLTSKDSLNRYNFTESRTIKANSRLVVVRNIDNFFETYPDVKSFAGSLPFKLGRPGDAIKLYDNNNSLVATVSYSDNYPWPLSGDESGRTLELRNPNGDLNDAYNWFAGCIGGSPDTAFKACEIINGVKQPTIDKPLFTAYPIPANDYINLAVNLSRKASNCSVHVYNIFGSEVKVVNLGSLEMGTFKTSVDLSDIPDGLLLIQFKTEYSSENIKIVHLR